mmetsp:Transcript_28063/g.39444  ORF Transcript_28063/g.39444 Transcript_28063/m.39444 type:complete len:211 (+) Transcript_28063:88-720(+)
MIPSSSIENKAKEEHYSAVIRNGVTNRCMRVKSLSESLSTRSLLQVPTRSNRQGQIRFSDVEIREYSIILGDNPSVSCGAPITISWDHDRETRVVIDVDEFETERAKSRKNREDLRIESRTREFWLRNAGFSTNQLIKSMKKCGHTFPLVQEPHDCELIEGPQVCKPELETVPQKTAEDAVNSISNRIFYRRQKSDTFINKKRFISAYSC